MSASKRDSESVYLQDRDLAFFRGLFESRLMTAAQAATLHFSGKKDYAKKRLQQLKAAGFIKAGQHRASEGEVLFLARRGFLILQEQGILSEYPPISLAGLQKRSQVSDFTIRHELDVMDVKAAFHSAIARTEQFSLAEFCTWPLIHQFEAQTSGYNGTEVLVKPDGFLRMHETESDGRFSKHTFFLEVDRSTETQSLLASRANCYLDYYKSGGFAVRNGAARSDFKRFPFRVLFVFKTPERRNNTTERLLHCVPPILNLVWLTTMAEVTSDPLGRIWIRPADYQKAVEGTSYERPNQSQVYRHQTQRDILVERHIRKRRLF